jgi:flagellar hook assembly protein FlgD
MKRNDFVRAWVCEYGDRVIIRVKNKKRKYIEIGIYDLEKNRIRTIYKGMLNEGKHKFFWDKRNDSRGMVPKGMYMVGIKMDGKIILSDEAIIFIF